MEPDSTTSYDVILESSDEEEEIAVVDVLIDNRSVQRQEEPRRIIDAGNLENNRPVQRQEEPRRMDSGNLENNNAPNVEFINLVDSDEEYEPVEMQLERDVENNVARQGSDNHNEEKDDENEMNEASFDANEEKDDEDEMNEASFDANEEKVDEKEMIDASFDANEEKDDDNEMIDASFDANEEKDDDNDMIDASFDANEEKDDDSEMIDASFDAIKYGRKYDIKLTVQPVVQLKDCLKWPVEDEESEGNFDDEESEGNFDDEDSDDGVHKFVWGIFSKKKTAYPAITYCKNDVPPEKVPVIWFGHHQVSDMDKDKLFSFQRHFTEKYNAQKATVRANVKEALELLAKMSNQSFGSDAQLIKWALDGFPNFKKDDTILNEFLSPILKKIAENEEEMKKRKQKASKRKAKKAEESEDETDTDKSQSRDRTVLKRKNVKEICLYCTRFDRELVPHPIFEGGLCKYQCTKKYKDNIFVIGMDQKQVCCIICGRAGDLSVCDSENCTKNSLLAFLWNSSSFRSYCKWCLDSFLNEEHVQKIEESPQWHCFLCTNEVLENCHLKIRTQWNIELLKFLDDNKHGIRYTDFSNKCPINVLSLFDGIGTGLQVLKELGIKVNKYFASEIDENAITVAKMNHKVSITHIGDINSVTRAKLQDLPKIDLVIGGSPCNDFSLANPARRNFEETSESRLFFTRFIDVLTVVKELNSNVFYLFENVCPMEKPTFDQIKKTFNNEKPANIDAKYFSPMKRSRYFWGNIPGLHGIPEFWSQTSESNKFILQDYLEPNLNRRAVVETIKTVTSQPNSLIQKGHILPVIMGDKPSQLWAKELERLFGFPVHYTEANLNPNQRLALLGKSWSIQVIKSIFSPLKNFFECN